VSELQKGISNIYLSSRKGRNWVFALSLRLLRNDRREASDISCLSGQSRMPCKEARRENQENERQLLGQRITTIRWACWINSSSKNDNSVHVHSPSWCSKREKQDIL